MTAPIDVRIIANLSDTDWRSIISTGLAGIFGAAVGGAIGYLGQLETIKEARRERETARRERQEALAYSLLMKLSKIYLDYRAFKQVLDDAAKRQTAARFREPWHSLQAISSGPGPITFSSDEKALVASMGDSNLFNDLMFMDEIHNATVGTFIDYSNRRNAHQQELDGEAAGNIIRTAETAEDIRRHGPTRYYLNSLAATLHGQGASTEAKALEVLQRAIALFHGSLGLSFSFDPKVGLENSLTQSNAETP